MKKLALGALFVGLTACGGGSDSTKVSLVDAAMPDGMSVCNPLTQGGCDPGQKCTWLEDSTNPRIGHIGCAVVGTVAIGGACMIGPAGPMGFDDCVAGAACVSGECKKICDVNDVAPLCDSDHSCARYQNLFDMSGTTVAGVCDPACDPLTQALKGAQAAPACGSPDPTKPTKGCYGFDDFSCSGTGVVASMPATLSVLDLTDRVMPRGDFLNSCAPGYVPFWNESETSMVTKCTGYCAALPIDMSTANRNNTLGDANALAKLPKEAAPAAMGNATCSAAKKGSLSGGPQECKFMWPVLEDDQGMLAASFTPYINKLGTCFSYTQFKYDHDGNAATPDEQFPPCNTLPATAPDPMKPSGGAAYFWCQPRPAAFTGTAAKLTHAPSDYHPALKTSALSRHSFE
jgi:hypothetical protein